MGAAHRAIGVFAQLEFTEFHGQCVDQEQAANQRLSLAQNEFDHFRGLDYSHQSRQDSQHSALSLTDDMALVGIISTQLIVHRFITHFPTVAHGTYSGTADLHHR